MQVIIYNLTNINVKGDRLPSRICRDCIKTFLNINDALVRFKTANIWTNTYIEIGFSQNRLLRSGKEVDNCIYTDTSSEDSHDTNAFQADNNSDQNNLTTNNKKLLADALKESDEESQDTAVTILSNESDATSSDEDEKDEMEEINEDENVEDDKAKKINKNEKDPLE